LEAAIELAPVCWTYNTKRPRYLYFSIDNKTTTYASTKFSFAEVGHLVVKTEETDTYTYWGLAQVGLGEIADLEVLGDSASEGLRA